VVLFFFLNKEYKTGFNLNIVKNEWLYCDLKNGSISTYNEHYKRKSGKIKLNKDPTIISTHILGYDHHGFVCSVCYQTYHVYQKIL
jgi:hypothetical protein